ncbi:ABC transporter permease [Sphingobacterium sp. lm-10]|uniref:ABC transporter permease n=1 Tax=Sphingobacterium sp. lm-10 TaxID=2944904 RepID=UPI00202226D2|nr:ABC transporter permease [Sphingobacterium sp. lm-10]MCL7989270.1 ABC transporter permease [Sphingobacterium sp. lm-10]
MSILQLVWKNITQQLGSALLSILLTAFGVAILVVIYITSDTFEKQLDNNSKHIDLVIGAKGSPLQLILSSIYHVDYPTGNILLSDAAQFSDNPLVDLAVPMSLGDNFNGHRIVGTDSSYFDLYELEIAQGGMWTKSFETVIGSETARKNKLKIGDQVHSAHGLAENGHVHDEHPFTVVGILEPTGTVVDNLLLCNLASIWDVHDIAHDDEHEHANEDHTEEHQHVNNEHDHDHGHMHDEKDPHHDHEHPQELVANAADARAAAQLENNLPDTTTTHVKSIGDDVYKSQGLEITSLLIRYSSPAAISTLPRMVNQSTAMQAASPAMETTRLFSLLGVGIDSLEILAYVIMLIAGLSVFISLYNALKERKYDLAIMRSLGAGKTKLFTLVIVEGLVITLIGGLVGLLFGHLALFYISTQTGQSADFIQALAVSPTELFILLIAAAIGTIAAILPAIKAYNTTISTILGDK